MDIRQSAGKRRAGNFVALSLLYVLTTEPILKDAQTEFLKKNSTIFSAASLASDGRAAVDFQAKLRVGGRGFNPGWTTNN